MISAENGPWVVGMLSRQTACPYFVCRQTGDSQWEQLQREDGLGIAWLETMDEAQQAADAANELNVTKGEQPLSPPK